MHQFSRSTSVGSHPATGGLCAPLALDRVFASALLAQSARRLRLFLHSAFALALLTALTGCPGYLPPPPVENLECRAKPTKVNLVWPRVPEARGYAVFRTVDDGPLTQVSLQSANVFADQGLENERVYRYQVYSLSLGGYSELPSNRCTAVPCPRGERCELPENAPPEIVSTPPLAGVVGMPYVYPVDAIDPDGDAPRVELIVAPDGMQLDGMSDVVMWTPGPDQVGPFDVTVRATDPEGESDEQSFVIDVMERGTLNLPPMFTSIPPTMAMEAMTFGYDAEADDPEGEALVYSLVAGPVGLTIDPETGLVSWTPTADQVGAVSVVIRATDPPGRFTDQAFELEVAPVVAENMPPEITSVPPTQAPVGVLYEYDVDASDPEGSPLLFDFNEAPSGMTIDPATGQIEWTPGEAQVGPNPVTVRARDPEGLQDLQSFVVDVFVETFPPAFTSIPPTASFEGSVYTYFPIAEDPDGGDVSIESVALPAGMILSDQGLLRWTPREAQVGPQPVTLRATDDEGDTATQVFDILVEARPDPPIITSLPATGADVGSPYAYDVEAYDPEGETLTYAFDGTVPPGMSIDGATGLIGWTPPAGTVGPVPIAVRATDPGGLFDLQRFAIQVVEDPVLVVSPTGEFEIAVGETLPLAVASNYANAILSASPPVENATLAPGGAWSFTPEAGQEGIYTVAFQARVGERKATSLVKITVGSTNGPPTIEPIPPQTVAEGETLTFGVVGADPDGDALRFSSPNTLDNAVFSEFSRLFQFNPGYDQAGVYDVEFTVSDGDASASTTAQITVTDRPPPPTALELVVDPPASPTLARSANISGNVVGAPGIPTKAPLPAFVTGLAPTSARQGRTAQVTLTARGLTLAQGSTTVDFGPDIEVTALTVIDASTAEAEISIGPDAALGGRRVSLSVDGERADSVVAFLVEPGAAQVSGVVQDPFTGEPLVGARVLVRGTSTEVVTDDTGAFTIDGLPPGEVQLLVSQPNFELQFVDVIAVNNQVVALDEPIEVRALARPATPGGTLPRAASLASVLDRNVGGKGGGLSFEQARLVVQDTILAVGGPDMGVLDEAGNQLNPRATGDGLFSLTPLAVDAQALALVDGDIQSLGEVLNDLADAFSWAGKIYDSKAMVRDFQRIVDEAWESPQSPESTLAIILFNEGTRISNSPPALSMDTRLNRFQSFLLVSSFLVTYGAEIEVLANQALAAQGIDPSTITAARGGPDTARPDSATEAMDLWLARSLSAAGAGANRVADWLLPPAFAQSTPPGPPDGGQEDRLTQSLRAVWKKARSSQFIAEVVIEALAAEAFKFAAQKVMVNIAGRTAGLPGAVGAIAVTQSLMKGAFSTMLGKLMELWAIERFALSFEPDRVDNVVSAGFEVINGARRYVIVFDRSPTDVAGGPGAGSNPVVRGVSGVDATNFRYTYHLLKYPDCDTRDYANAQLVLNATLQPVYMKDADGNPTDSVIPNRMQFVIPPEAIDPGVNLFRIVTFQIYSSEDIAPNAARVEYGFDDLDVEAPPILDTMVQEVSTGVEGLVTDLTLELAEIELESQRLQNAVQEGVISVVDAEFLAKSQEKRLKAIQRDIQTEVEGRLRSEGWKVAQDAGGNLLTPPNRRNDLMNLIETHRQSNGALDDWLDPESAVRVQANQIIGGEGLDDETARAAREIMDGLNQADQARVDLDLSTTAVEKLKIPRGNSSDDIVFQEIAPDGTRRTRRYEVALTGQLVDSETREFFEWDDVIAEQEARVDAARRTHLAATGRVRDAVPPVNRRVLDTTGALERLRNQWDASWVKAALARVNAVRTKINSIRAKFRRGIRRGRLAANTGIYAAIESVQGRARNGRNVADVDLAKPKVQRNLNALRALGGVIEVGGKITDVLSFQNDMKERVRTLASPPSQCFQVPGDGTNFPGFPIETHPNYRIDGVIAPIDNPENPNGGFLSIAFPGTDWAPNLASAGFPSDMIATDARGNIYANNARSNFNYGGRVFRYDQVIPGGDFQLSRQLIGAVNYYSLQLQYGRPADPVAMEISDYIDSNGVTWQDLFVADFDLLSDIGTRTPRLRRIPIHLIEEFPGGYDGPARQRMASVGYVEHPDFQFNSVMDMEVGPPGFFAPNNPPRSLWMSDSSRVFEIFQTGPGASPTTEVQIEVPGRRFAGLAFDNAGNLFLTDMAFGEAYVWPATDQDEPIVGEDEFRARTYPIKVGLDQPRDIEISADEDRYFVSTAEGIEYFWMPIVGREGPEIRDIKVKTHAKEYDVTRRGPLFENTFIAAVTHDDALDAGVRILVERRDPDTNRYSWKEYEIELSMAGITILDEEL